MKMKNKIETMTKKIIVISAILLNSFMAIAQEEDTLQEDAIFLPVIYRIVFLIACLLVVQLFQGGFRAERKLKVKKATVSKDKNRSRFINRFEKRLLKARGLAEKNQSEKAIQAYKALLNQLESK